jgi:predicted DNA-binding ribbon-helix-helix protein
MCGTSEIKSSLISKNLTIDGRRTSVRLEPEMWDAFYSIAKREQCSIHDIGSIVNARKKKQSSLTAAIRVFVMLYYRAAATEEGHRLANHGNIERMKKRAGLDYNVYALAS